MPGATKPIADLHRQRSVAVRSNEQSQSASEESQRTERGRSTERGVRCYVSSGVPCQPVRFENEARDRGRAPEIERSILRFIPDEQNAGGWVNFEQSEKEGGGERPRRTSRTARSAAVCAAVLCSAYAAQKRGGSTRRFDAAVLHRHGARHFERGGFVLRLRSTETRRFDAAVLHSDTERGSFALRLRSTETRHFCTPQTRRLTRLSCTP